ncbi:MAG: preprotein translocase subunit SecA [Candidatus Methylacidiphilales bacterium]|nr:preprotein translocase subunit SecA [Candidatus Methylacidiphilales bacterium]
MIQWILHKIVGTRNQREVKRLRPLVARINYFDEEFRTLSDEQIQAKTAEFRNRLKQGETLDDLLPEAFATVKSCCRRFTQSGRVVNVRGQDIPWVMIPFDVQLMGGITLHQGRIAEMATGEGKTLVATLPTYLNALSGRGVHVVTVNDYLAQRDSEWMGEIYRWLGLTVGCLLHGQSPAERRQQYAADITYGTNSEFGFDYLRDNGMATSQAELVQRGHFFAIVDEVDSILIDEARTPLIISGPATVSTHQYDKYKSTVANLVRRQSEECSQLANEAKKLIDEGRMPEAGRLLLKVKFGMPRNKILLKCQEEPEIRRAIDDAELELYQDTRRTELYKIKEELLFTIEEKSSEADLSEKGRQFLDPSDPDNFVLPDLITLNHDIDSDPSLSEEDKLRKKQEVQAAYDDSNQRIHNISQLLRAYCIYEKDVQYVVQDNKVIIVDEYTGRLMPGRRWSDGLHQAVEAKEGVKIDRETQTLATITIQNYFRLYEKLAGMTGTAETEAHEFNDIYKLQVVTMPTHRPCVRKDADDVIFKTRREKLSALITDIKERHAKGQPILVGTTTVESSEVISRFLKRENIPHNVLNAKYHQSEAEIVARAGQKGAVTIATNMAGRGTDIKLGPGVSEIGGLHVVGTERHEARRIDRQLRGRCARQGDPGSSQFYISFEDDLMRNFGDSRRISGMMTRLGMEDNEGLQHPWLNTTVETAQKRVEQRNYQIRKHTLQYDDVMNQQRMVIYTNRMDIIESQDCRTELFQVVNDVLDEETAQRLEEDHRDVEGLIRWLNTTMPLGLRQEDLDWTQPVSSLAAAIKERVRKAYELKTRFENPEALQAMERMILLNAIDRPWQEHLYAMDGLRTSIGLRAYAQKDPLIEYKQEAYAMFEELMRTIKRETVHNLFRSTTNLAAFEDFLRNLPQFLGRGPDPELETRPPETREPGTEPAAKPDITLPIHREIPKIGRNDLVTIRKGSETQTVKFKKAEPLLAQGWVLVNK